MATDGLIGMISMEQKWRVTMSTRTVRLDEETEKILQQIMRSTGLSISAAFKKGLLLLRDEMAQKTQRLPYDICRELNLGPGGYAIACSTETRRGVQEAIRKKLRR
jgi:hypothetical protein